MTRKKRKVPARVAPPKTIYRVTCSYTFSSYECFAAPLVRAHDPRGALDAAIKLYTRDDIYQLKITSVEYLGELEN